VEMNDADRTSFGKYVAQVIKHQPGD
jgi:hypothetical protein